MSPIINMDNLAKDDVARPPEQTGSTRWYGSRSWYRPMIRLASVFAVVLACYLALVLISRPTPTGDEPTYLLIAQSIVHDHDLSLANNYANAHELHVAFPVGGTLSTTSHAAVYRPDGPLVPIHGIGLPLLLSPVIATGHGWLVARMLLALIAALIAPMLITILDRLFPRRRRLVTIATVSVMLTAPVFMYAGQIYPDIPGAFLITLTLALLIVPPSRARFLAAASLTASLLPWFHVRFLFLTLALAIALIVLAWTRADSSALMADRRRRLIAALAPLAISGAGLMFYQQALYGSPLPNAAYRHPPFPDPVGFGAKDIYVWSVGDFLGPGFGVVVLAPILLVSVAGAVVMIARWRWWGTLAVVSPVAYYVLASATAEAGGFCPPGRWLVAIAPLFSVALMAALDQNWRPRLVFLVLTPYSLLISAIIASNFQDVYRGSDTTMVPVAHWFAPIFPSTASVLEAGFELPADDLYRQIGHVEPDSEAVARPADGAGALAYGPTTIILPGVYTATYTFSSVSGAPGQIVGGVDILDGPTVVAVQSIVVPSSGSGPVTVQAQAYVKGYQTQTRVIVNGTGTVMLDRISLIPSVPGSIVAPRPRESLPLVGLWFGIIGLIVMMCFPRRRPTARAVRPGRYIDD